MTTTRCVHRKSSEQSVIPGWHLYNMTCVALRVSSIVDCEIAPLFCSSCGLPSYDLDDDVKVQPSLFSLSEG